MLERLLITGANGNLGSLCRKRLGHLAKTLRVSARKGLGDAGPNEEIVYCELDDKPAVEALAEGLSVNNFRVYTSDDIVGVEVGGAV